MEELTKEQAIERSIELWDWLAGTGAEKGNWPGWEVHGEARSHCFLCEYSLQVCGHPSCRACPYYQKYGFCMASGTPYYWWTEMSRLLSLEERKEHARNFLEQLKTL